MARTRDQRAELTDRVVWSAEALAILAFLGVVGLGFAVFALLSVVFPQARWVTMVITGLPSLWLARRSYATVLGRRGFAPEGLGKPKSVERP